MAELDVYILGAGASYVHGAPLTDEILWYALTQAGIEGDRRAKQLKRFLREVFGFRPKVGSRQRPPWEYPGLVDVLSLVDMALDRRQSLSRTYNLEGLRQVRHALEFAIYHALAHSLSRSSKSGRRSRATRAFVEKLRKNHSAIISFNYDLIIDVALQRRLGPHQFGVDSMPQAAHQLATVDYGIHFRGTRPVAPEGQPYKLLKLHGSLNWLHDPLTDEVYYGGLKKVVGAVFSDRGRLSQDLERYFDERPGGLNPILVTPTHLKDLRNVHIAELWHQAGEVLRRATSLTFIGYSLPGDDLHIKYLFKRALFDRPDDLQITLVNHVPAEQRAALGPREKPAIVRTYERFFGSRVEAHLDGFEDYVERVMPPPRRGR